MCIRDSDDPDHVSRQEREVEGEPRWQTIGMLLKTLDEVDADLDTWTE